MWQRAFTDIPRHVFVPDHSLTDAYSLTALVTQQRPADELDNNRPTSSASAPGAVAVMLERLAAQDHHRVLEIGTGTGYNAALLCHRLGATNVYSNDIDPALVDQAKLALNNLGYHPTLAATDGYTGLTDGAPYDRILATWRSPISHPSGYDNSPMAAVSSPPSPVTRPSPSSFSTKQHPTR